VVLWRRRERRLAALLLASAVVTYIAIELTLGYLPRIASWAVLPLMVLAAVSLSAFGQQVAGLRPRQLAPVAGVVVVALSLFALDRFARFAAAEAVTPFEAASTAGQIIRGLPGTDALEPVITNYPAAAYTYYALPRRHVQPRSGPELENIFCTAPGPFVYIEQDLFPPHPSLACLRARGAFRITLAQRRSHAAVWLVPRASRQLPAGG
jgi:hypothetical protein